MAITPIFELNNSANWELIYSETRTAVFESSTEYQPFPKYTIPYLFDSRVLAIKIASSTAKPNWRNAGTIYQYQNLGLGVNEKVILFKKRLTLFQTELFVFPPYSAGYYLEHDVPWWIDQLTIEIYQYNGTEQTVEAMVQSTLNSMEIGLKLDI